MSVAHGESAARDLRHALGYGDTETVDVLKSAQDAGALVVLSSIPGGPQGMFARRVDDPWIFVNTDSAKPPLLGRQRFTIAHELGHWRLGHSGSLDKKIDLYGSTGEEADANAFAAELLVPKRALTQILGESNSRIDLETVVGIASRFGVSCQVVIFRLASIGVLPAAAKRKLRDACERREHLRGILRQRQLEFADQLTLRLHEANSPGALVVPRELSRRVEDLWEHGVLDDAEAAAHARMSDHAFRKRMRRFGVEPASTDDLHDEWW